jgi:hypothetical protein
MPRGSGGKSRVRGGSTGSQPRHRGKGSKGGEKKSSLMNPKHAPAGRGHTSKKGY